MLFSAFRRFYHQNPPEAAAPTQPLPLQLADDFPRYTQDGTTLQVVYKNEEGGEAKTNLLDGPVIHMTFIQNPETKRIALVEALLENGRILSNHDKEPMNRALALYQWHNEYNENKSKDGPEATRARPPEMDENDPRIQTAKTVIARFPE